MGPQLRGVRGAHDLKGKGWSGGKDDCRSRLKCCVGGHTMGAQLAGLRGAHDVKGKGDMARGCTWIMYGR